MNEEYIELLEPAPELHDKKCKIMAFALRLFLEYTTIITTLIVWFFYDLFLALLTLVLIFIVMGIVRSKLRNSSIPFAQREQHFDDKEIAQRYTATMLC